MRHSKRKSVLKAPVKPYIGSFEEAMEKLREFIDVERYRNDPYAGDVTADELAPFLKDVWEAAYGAGRSDARSDAAVEAAEAEWFNG